MLINKTKTPKYFPLQQNNRLSITALRPSRPTAKLPQPRPL